MRILARWVSLLPLLLSGCVGLPEGYKPEPETSRFVFIDDRNGRLEMVEFEEPALGAYSVREFLASRRLTQIERVELIRRQPGKQKRSQQVFDPRSNAFSKDMPLWDGDVLIIPGDVE